MRQIKSAIFYFTVHALDCIILATHPCSLVQDLIDVQIWGPDLSSYGLPRNHTSVGSTLINVSVKQKHKRQGKVTYGAKKCAGLNLISETKDPNFLLQESSPIS